MKPDSKVYGANTGPTLGRQDPAGPHVGHVNLAIWETIIIVQTTLSCVVKLSKPHY